MVPCACAPPSEPRHDQHHSIPTCFDQVITSCSRRRRAASARTIRASPTAASATSRRCWTRSKTAARRTASRVGSSCQWPALFPLVNACLSLAFLVRRLAGRVLRQQDRGGGRGMRLRLRRRGVRGEVLLPARRERVRPGAGPGRPELQAPSE